MNYMDAHLDHKRGCPVEVGESHPKWDAEFPGRACTCKEIKMSSDIPNDPPTDQERAEADKVITAVAQGIENKLKETNPKDAVGVKKAPFSTVSMQVVAEVGLGMLEGARKYGRHNYRIAGVRASVYFDATIRHLTAWWEGEDIDPMSGLNHIVKALASLFVLRDAMNCSKWYDDRPPSLPAGWQEELAIKAAEIIARYPDAKEPFTITSIIIPINKDAR